MHDRPLHHHSNPQFASHLHNLNRGDQLRNRLHHRARHHRDRDRDATHTDRLPDLHPVLGRRDALLGNAVGVGQHAADRVDGDVGDGHDDGDGVYGDGDGADVSASDPPPANPWPSSQSEEVAEVACANNPITSEPFP